MRWTRIAMWRITWICCLPWEERQKEDIDRSRRELKTIDKRMDELNKILNKLYEDAALEKISEERYQAMAPKYEREQIELRGKGTPDRGTCPE